MGVEYESVTFFGWLVDWGDIYEWLQDIKRMTITGKSDPDDLDDDDLDIRITDEEVIQMLNKIDGVALNDKYRVEWVRPYQYLGVSPRNEIFGFGVRRNNFSCEDMLALANYMSLPGYPELKNLQDVLGLKHEEPTIRSLVELC